VRGQKPDDKDQIGKDTDNHGRPVKLSHKPGEVTATSRSGASNNSGLAHDAGTRRAHGVVFFLAT
jgi:hypothetical protein